MKLLKDETRFAKFAVNALVALIALGTQVLPFQDNASPYAGATVTVSTSANTLMLANDKLAYALAFE